MIEINHEYYVSLEVAKLLKKLGFDWDTYNAYNKDGVFANKNRNLITWNHFSDYYSAPTLEVAQRWLREVKHLDIIVNRNHPIHEPQYFWEYEYVIIATDGRVKAVDCYFEEYEQAQEAGIKKALEIILEEGE